MIGSELFLALILIRADVVVHLEEAGEVSIEEALAVCESLGAAITSRIGEPPQIEDVLWSSCDRSDRCISEIRARTSASRIVMVRVFGAPTALRVIAERFDTAASARRETFDLPRDRAAWRALIAQAAEKLFPEPPPARAAVAVVAPPLVDDPARVAPYVLLGGTAIAAAFAIGFGLSNNDARSEIEQAGIVRADRDYQTIADRQYTHGLIANIAIGAAATTAVAAAISWLTGWPR